MLQARIVFNEKGERMESQGGVLTVRHGQQLPEALGHWREPARAEACGQRLEVSGQEAGA